MKPLLLAPNQPPHFYRGGSSIGRFRGLPEPVDNRPEDWLASTTTRFGQPFDGLTTLPDGRYLRDALAADPEAWFGPAHAARFGGDPYLLVKLLDAGERLPVHIHPSRAVVERHLALHHGKTEAWFVLDASGSDPAVFVGFVSDVEPDDLHRWADQQQVETLLRQLHRLEVAPGDSVLVPAGTPHAIGPGIFLVEVQEPADLSIMLETAGFELDQGRDWHLGLGADVAFECVRRSAVDDAELSRMWRHAESAGEQGVSRVFDEQADPYFRAEHIRPGPPVDLAASFAVMVTAAGGGQLGTERGGELPLRMGDTVLVPFAAGGVTVSGPVEVIRCLPPRPKDVAGPDEGGRNG